MQSDINQGKKFWMIWYYTKVVLRLIIVQGDQGNVSATLSFKESSYFPAFISHIYQIVLLQQAATFKKWVK